tara:strand:- start:2390 stop:2728 length:339 start_codon:yes stop_codon:yes gene_type:complete
MRNQSNSKNSLESLSFIKKNKSGIVFYPRVSNQGHQYGEQSGKTNAIELIAFYEQNGFQKEVLSRMLVSLIGLDPANDELTPEQETMIGHIKGISSVAHHYICIGILASKNS